MVASASNGQQMEGQSKKKREYGDRTIIYLGHQQPSTWSVTTAYTMQFLSSP